MKTPTENVPSPPGDAHGMAHGAHHPIMYTYILEGLVSHLNGWLDKHNNITIAPPDLMALVLIIH